jgi:hypothetical protein
VPTPPTTSAASTRAVTTFSFVQNIVRSTPSVRAETCGATSPAAGAPAATAAAACAVAFTRAAGAEDVVASPEIKMVNNPAVRTRPRRSSRRRSSVRARFSRVATVPREQPSCRAASS